jgi:hypothetical protein
MVDVGEGRTTNGSPGKGGVGWLAAAQKEEANRGIR